MIRMIRKLLAERARANLITQAEAEEREKAAALERLAADAKAATARWEQELARIRGEVVKATAASERFVVIEYQSQGFNYKKFVKAVAQVANEGGVELVSFTHEVWPAWDSAYSKNECAVLTLSLPIATRKAA